MQGEQPAAPGAGLGERLKVGDEIAVGVAAAPVESPLLLADPLHDFSAALRAVSSYFYLERLRILALGETAAGDKFPEAPRLDYQRLAAFGTGVTRFLIRQLHLLRRLERILQVFIKRSIEVLDNTRPVALLAGDIVELVFHVGGKFDIDNVGEMPDEQIIDRHAQFGGLKDPLDLADVLTVLNRGYRRRVGAGSANAVLF